MVAAILYHSSYSLSGGSHLTGFLENSSRCGFDDRADVFGVNRVIASDESGPTSHKYSVSVRWPHCPLFQGDILVSILMGGIRGVLSDRNAHQGNHLMSALTTESTHTTISTWTLRACIRSRLLYSVFCQTNNPCLILTLFGGSSQWKHK